MILLLSRWKAFRRKHGSTRRTLNCIAFLNTFENSRYSRMLHRFSTNIFVFLRQPLLLKTLWLLHFLSIFHLTFGINVQQHFTLNLRFQNIGQILPPPPYYNAVIYVMLFICIYYDKCRILSGYDRYCYNNICIIID